VPFFFKQWGGRTPKSGGRELEGREWNQMPQMGCGSGYLRGPNGATEEERWQ